MQNFYFNLISSTGNKAAVLQLIEGGANVNQINEVGNTALIFAADKSNFRIFHHLRKKCSNFTLFSHLDHREVVELLIQKGANINHTNRDNETAILLPAGRGNLVFFKA